MPGDAQQHPGPVKRTSPEEESDYTLVLTKNKRKKKKAQETLPAPVPAPATPLEITDSETPPATGTSRFKIHPWVGNPVDLVTALSRDARLSFQASPNRYGDFVLYTKCQRTSSHFSSLNQLQQMKEKTSRALILHYPQQLTLDPVRRLNNIASVERCTTKTGEPLRKLVVTFRGNTPKRIHLGVWGSFPTSAFTPEPLRCYKCQKFGHHQIRCTSDFAVCGVCSEHHPTELCISKLKKKEATTTRCPNCGKNHHAWSRYCKVRLGLIHRSKEKANPTPATTAAVPTFTQSSFPRLPHPHPSSSAFSKPNRKQQDVPKNPETSKSGKETEPSTGFVRNTDSPIADLPG